jgi:hypothetical protein
VKKEKEGDQEKIMNNQFIDHLLTRITTHQHQTKCSLVLQFLLHPLILHYLTSLLVVPSTEEQPHDTSIPPIGQNLNTSASDQQLTGTSEERNTNTFEISLDQNKETSAQSITK